jgi:Spy/CpxP family protein refolding chaperone
MVLAPLARRHAYLSVLQFLFLQETTEMNATRRNLVWLMAAVAVAGILVEDADAQRRGRGRFGFTWSRVDLASLAEVQSDLMLTDAQKTQVNQIAEEFREKRGDLFQGGGGGGGNVAAMRTLTTESSEKLMGALDDKQRTRINEVFVQVNGAGALADEMTAKSLSLTDEQTQKIESIVQDARQQLREARQDGASQEEAREARQKITDERDTKLLAVLSDEQKQSFEKMKGESLEIDLSQLFGRRGGRGN